MYVTLTLFVIAVFAWSGLRPSERIIKTSTIENIETETQSANEKTLVVFDCDDVLIRTVDNVFGRKNERLLISCINSLLKQYPELGKKMKKLKGIVAASAKQTLVDERMPEFIKKLQSRGVKVLVVTSMKNEILNGKFAIEIRKKELKDFGYDFLESWKDLDSKWFGEEEKSQYYEAGIVCAKPGNKYTALRNFLAYSGFEPDKIIFVDDNIQNLVDVKKLAKEKNIEFKGYEYTGAELIPHEFKVSRERIIFQLEYLAKNEHWLSDKEAEEMLNSTKR